MERGKAREMLTAKSPLGDQKMKQSFTVAPLKNQTITNRPNNAQRIGISYRAEGGGHGKKGLQKGKAKLGLDYEGLELGASSS